MSPWVCRSDDACCLRRPCPSQGEQSTAFNSTNNEISKIYGSVYLEFMLEDPFQDKRSNPLSAVMTRFMTSFKALAKLSFLPTLMSGRHYKMVRVVYKHNIDGALQTKRIKVVHRAVVFSHGGF
jgi:hypothetical protein